MKSSGIAARRGVELDDDQRVSEELVVRLYQAAVQSVPEVVASLTLAQRANLARFCYRKAHLHDIGLAIAATCDQETLVNTWGTSLGRALYDQSRAPVQPGAVRCPGRREITLGRMPARVLNAFVREDDGVSDAMIEGEDVVRH